MALGKMTADVEIHQSQPASFSQDYTITQALFDEAATLLKEYLNETLTVEIDTTMATKAELAAAVISGISPGSITDGSMATDVKIGSLAGLTTTAKTNVTGAINEVDENTNLVTTKVNELELIMIMGGM